LRGLKVSIPSNIEVLSPWRIIASSSERPGRLSTELSSELSPKHVLYGLQAKPVAIRIDRDDVLFEIEGGPAPLAVVHLTWQKESDSRWPRTRIFATWEEWVRLEMLPASRAVTRAL
jgi:hypothetical protein